MDHTKDIMDVVKFFQYAFIIVFALALGEAFKQFVAEKANQPRDKVVRFIPGGVGTVFCHVPRLVRGQMA